MAAAATGREQVVEEEVPSVGKGFKNGFFWVVALVPQMQSRNYRQQQQQQNQRAHNIWSVILERNSFSTNTNL